MTKVMTLDEVCETQGDDIVMIESRAAAETMAALYSREHYPNLYFYTKAGECKYHAYSYGKSWRCWNKKPTYEQRKTEPWEA